jgi:hypothetical protein
MRRAAFLALVLFAAAGCDQPPLKEIAAAEAQVDAARKAGADAWAADRIKEADAALAQARRHVQGRDYRAALSAASDAAERARGAIQAVKVAREAARGRTEVAVTDARASLAAADAAHQQALLARVPEAAFEELRTKAVAVRHGLEEVAALLEKDDLQAAADRAEALKAEAAQLPEVARAARTRGAGRGRAGTRPRGARRP